MENIEIKPYKLFNKVRHYEWGTQNQDAFIPNFLGIEAQNELPYAELWIGAHPSAPSEIEVRGEKLPLYLIIENFTAEFLGHYVSEKFNGKFPFLLKVLSAAHALSIQTHPNKNQAAVLHNSDPVNYPDDNHKPEIAIAIDSLTAIAGFRPAAEIATNLYNYPELYEFAEDNLSEKIPACTDKEELNSMIKDLYAQIMRQSGNAELVAKVIEQMRLKITSKKMLSIEEEQFLIQYSHYGVDVGLISFFFFNMVQLKPGQAIFTDAGVPHAYIKGNIIECMANSDNVVRAGLTNKFKDVKTLLQILKYDFSPCEIINQEQQPDEYSYHTAASEFEVSIYTKKAGFRKDFSSGNKPAIFLIMKGSVEVKYKKNEIQASEVFSKGDTFLIPAALEEFSVFCTEEASFYQIEIPHA
ncbi:MAG: mannose-6-phosphate isomerase, class I [Methanococcaceae archaeon]